MFDGSRAPSFVLRESRNHDGFLLVCECMPLFQNDMTCFGDLRPVAEMSEITFV